MPRFFPTLSTRGEADELDETSSSDAWTQREFTRLVSPHIPRLYRLCLVLCRDSSEAEDLLQNSLVKAYVHRASYAGIGSVAAWLYGIVRHENAESVRARTRRRSLLEAAVQGMSDLLDGVTARDGAATDPEALMIHRQDGELLLTCLRQIPEPHRTVVHLCDVEELPYDEVARILDIPVGTVKSRHARGRVKLRIAYEMLVRRGGVNS